MHEHVVGVLALAVEHDLVTGAAGLVLDHLDDSAPRSDDARALARGEILALVAMALARGAEARALPTPAEGAGQRKGVMAELELGGARGGGSAAQAAPRDVQEVAALGKRGAGLEAGEGDRVAARGLLADIDRLEPRAVVRV